MKNANIIMLIIIVITAILCSAAIVCGDEVKYKTMRVTAYCPCEKCCGSGSPGVTASGLVIQEGDRFVAAPRSIAMKTWIRIPGYNNNEPVRVEDRGGAVTEGRLDVYFDSHTEAIKFGVKYIRVEIAR
jgi:3D (Asp-Asp-Asp) domain-containing protein